MVYDKEEVDFKAKYEVIRMTYAVGKVAKISGISLRTLRYYDQIGLLSPKKNTESGYRIYTEDDLLKLQQILFYKELAFSLEEISTLVSAPDFDRKKALESQIKLLKKQSEKYAVLAQLATNTLINLNGGIKMKANDMFEGFDYEKMLENQKKHEPEVVERWGSSDAYKISKDRTSKYSKEDWEKINAEQSINLENLSELYKSGVSFDNSKVQKLVENAHIFIDKYFYPCSLEIFSGLGNMYVLDERFAANYEKYSEGLTKFYNEAIQFYCITKA